MATYTSGCLSFNFGLAPHARKGVYGKEKKSGSWSFDDRVLFLDSKPLSLIEMYESNANATRREICGWTRLNVDARLPILGGQQASCKPE